MNTLPEGFTDKKRGSEQDEDNNRIKNIVNGINNDVDNNRRNKKKKIEKSYDTEDDEDEKDEKDEKDKKKKAEIKENERKKEKLKKESNSDKSFYFNIPDMIKDPVLIWLVYMLMSQNFFKKLVGKYVSSINPTEEGVVPLTGVAVYGIILVSLYTLIKLILKQINKY